MDGQSTCWNLIDGAADGVPEARAEFARRYESSVTAYLRARWAQNRFLAELEDTVQDVFLECFRPGGVLERVDKGRPGGFRAFLYGVVRNVAMRAETRRVQRGQREERLATGAEVETPDDEWLAKAFDGAWAKARMREAARRHEDWAKRQTEAEQRRVELLKLRFQQGMSVGDIADNWGVKSAHVYKQIDKAHGEFRQALMEVVAFYHPGTPAEVEAECEVLRELVGV